MINLLFLYVKQGGDIIETLKENIEIYTARKVKISTKELQEIVTGVLYGLPYAASTFMVRKEWDNVDQKWRKLNYPRFGKGLEDLKKYLHDQKGLLMKGDNEAWHEGKYDYDLFTKEDDTIVVIQFDNAFYRNREKPTEYGSVCLEFNIKKSFGF